MSVYVTDSTIGDRKPAVKITGDPGSDRRPRLALIIGDGMSRGLLKAIGLHERIRTAPMIPAPPDAVFLPAYNLPFDRQPLWSERLFPELFEVWKQFGGQCQTLGSDRPFFAELANHRPLIEMEQGRFSSWFEVGFELRGYLWSLFRYYDSLADAPLQYSWPPPVLNWPWTSVLPYLACNFRMTVVSYNYDVLLERTLGLLGIKVIDPVDQCVEATVNRPTHCVLLLKPHGSIAHTGPAILSRLGGRSRWSPVDMIRNSIIHRLIDRVEYPPMSYPDVADLVPPGHDHNHLLNWENNVADACRAVVADADALIVCGLSASSPDTPEIAALVSRYRPARPVWHVDFPPGAGTERTPIYDLLARPEYERVDPHDVRKLPDRLSPISREHRPQQDRDQAIRQFLAGDCSRYEIADGHLLRKPLGDTRTVPI